ncbi:OmpA/MotB family protein [Neptunomonas qingdaonensis]|uniref:Flagellar motor protein MotB n=1 Tax=Neptunomonas qingdaonensis TaxID=1045558 RepID=A0A1I2TU24_9GAMM|nr:OmpA family protein [Neptunomonas qingdaonensis]SFG68445.1 Flagellar motor protein MotB [Neptunomonas qingdaonensis]
MRMRFSKKPSVDEDNPYWISFSDIMSSLLIIFILAAVVLIVQLMEIQEKLEERQQKFTQEVEFLKEAEGVRRTILQEAAEMLIKRGIQVSVSENETVLSISNDILGFKTGAYEVGLRYQSTALQIGEVLSEVIRSGNRSDYLDTIFIEGHTDDRPTAGFMGKGNWGLSAFRAISLWQFWDKALLPGSQLDELRNKELLPLFSVSGYAETRPVTDKQETEEEYSLNRRVDIRFTIRRPNSADYEALLGRQRSRSIQ